MSRGDGGRTDSRDAGRSGWPGDRRELEFGSAEFGAVQQLARAAGLDLAPDKRAIVRFRLARRVRDLGLDSFREYLEIVREGPNELWAMIDALTNNSTSFFRDPQQYPLLRAALAETLSTAGQVRIWSAGCSTGEEPLTLAMLAHHWFPEHAGRVRILGTDLSGKAVAKARTGRYDRDGIQPIPQHLRDAFLAPAAVPGVYEVVPEVRRSIRLARLNLMDPWPMRRRLHVIFCRNVMIYFDRATRDQLTERFRTTLHPGGYLFVGQSEALPPRSSGFEFLDHAVYRKPEGTS